MDPCGACQTQYSIVPAHRAASPSFLQWNAGSTATVPRMCNRNTLLFEGFSSMLFFYAECEASISVDIFVCQIGVWRNSSNHTCDLRSALCTVCNPDTWVCLKGIRLVCHLWEVESWAQHMLSSHCLSWRSCSLFFVPIGGWDSSCVQDMFFA